MDFDLNKAIQYFQTVVTKHYTDFQGRVSRQNFWTCIAVYFALAVVVIIVQGIVGIALQSCRRATCERDIHPRFMSAA